MPQIIYTYRLHIKLAFFTLTALKLKRASCLYDCFSTFINPVELPLFFMSGHPKHGAICTMAHMWKAYCLKEVAEKEVKSRA